MFSLLVALTMYMTFTPTKPGLTAADYRPPRRASLPLAANAARQVVQPVPTKKDASRIGIETSARAVMVADWKTGAALFEKNADDPQAIASITKLMTALVVLGEGPSWDAEVEVKASDERPGGIPYLIPGERVTVRDLFNLSLVASSNGGTVALARSTGLTGEEFAAKMNEVAGTLGMSGSSFTEPTGLDATNMATARDVAILLRTALGKEEIRETVAKREYRLVTKGGLARTVKSTDELLGGFLSKEPYHFLGGKTGYIEEAGYCFAAAAENGNGDGVIAVVLGTSTKERRFKEVKSLMYWAFDAYAWPPRELTRR